MHKIDIKPKISKHVSFYMFLNILLWMDVSGFLKIYPWVCRDIFSMLVANFNFKNVWWFLFPNYLPKYIPNCLNCIFKVSKMGLKGRKDKKSHIPIGFDTLPNKYGEYMTEVWMDYAMVKQMVVSYMTIYMMVQMTVLLMAATYYFQFAKIFP